VHVVSLCVFRHVRNDFLERLHPGDFLHPKPLKISGQGTHERPLEAVQLASAFGLALAFGLFLTTPSMAVLKVTSSDTSLAMISASTRMAVLICAAPPLSANNPDRISSRIDCSAGLRAPSARRCETPAKPCLKAFLLPGGLDLPRMRAMP
jgi:hypothetical protein